MWNDKIKKLFLNYGGLFDYVYYSSKDIELHFRLGLTAHIMGKITVRIFFSKIFHP